MSVRKPGEVPIEPVAAGQGTAKQVLIGSDTGPHFQMRRFIMQPGGGMPRHTNAVEHEQYVLRGRATIGIGDEVLEVEAGDAVFIPAGVPHWYRADDSGPFEFLCMVPNLPDHIELAPEPD